MAYYRTCLICGAALDPDERCKDCLGREETASEAKRKEIKTATALQRNDGQVERDLGAHISTSSLSKN